MALQDIHSQGDAIEKLQRAWSSGRIGQSYIFAGSDGVGRFKAASEWAKLLLCENPVEGNGFADSCGGCKSCLLFEAGNHPDFHHICKELYEFTDDAKGKAKTPSVYLRKAVIDEFLIAKASNRPGHSQRAIYVISETEKVNAASQNAMLKILEEPPGHCYIILLCTRIENLLPTIRSRCQVVRFGRVDKDIIVNLLAENGIGEDEAGYWAKFTDGSIGQSLFWAKLDIFAMRSELVSAFCKIKLVDVGQLSVKMLDVIAAIAKKMTDSEKGVSAADLKRRAQKLVVDISVSVFSDAMKIGTIGDWQIVNSDKAGEIKALANRLGVEKCAEKIEFGYRAIRQIDSSVNDKLICEQLLIDYAS